MFYYAEFDSLFWYLSQGTSSVPAVAALSAVTSGDLDRSEHFLLTQEKNKRHKREIRKLSSPSSNQQHSHNKKNLWKCIFTIYSSLGKKPSKEKNTEKFKEVYKKGISVYTRLRQLRFFREFSAFTIKYCNLTPFYFQLSLVFFTFDSLLQNIQSTLYC